MNQITFFIFLLFTLTVTPKFVTAAPTVKLKTDYYLINGRTASEIRNNLNTKSPIRKNGTSYDARTDWFVTWNYRWEKSDELCTITKIETSVDVRFILPKLRTPGTLPKTLRLKWDAYITALLRHEHGHKDIGIRAASKIESTILNMASRRTCKQLEIDANHIGNNTLGKFRAIEKEYDHKNNHGMNDGAMFP